MWFTRVSLNNPVFATMMMLALVVLGAFSLQRLKVDQFPNIDFPVVVITVDYPGAAPEVVESEVTKTIEEAVNAIAGISALTSRSYQGTAVVIMEFQLYVDGRRAAEDVREKIAAVRPLLRDEVKEPRVIRFDPSDAAVWSLAVVPEHTHGAPPSPIALTSWAEQVLKKRLENVRGVGAVNLVGSTPREINIYLNPQQMEALNISAGEVADAVRRENQDLPLGSVRSQLQDRLVQIDSRMKRPEDFDQIIVAQRNGSPVYLHQVAQVQDGAQELQNLALYSGERTLLLSVQKSQEENTIEVVDGLMQAVAELRADLPAGVRLVPIADASRPIRVAVNNVRQTLIEGAMLTVLIVFLFLQSWRSTVITGLTLPISIIGTFFFMYVFGFSINMVTLMALSLCVGLLIDDAIVVRENIVRHLQMGKSAFRAALDGTQEIGLAVLATTLSIVAVFLPIGFMGGIIGKFFHEFGLTIVVAVLLSMFVSFTLDPMLSSVWHDPSVQRDAAQRPRNWYERSIGRLLAGFEVLTQQLTQGYQRLLAWALEHKRTTLVASAAIFVLSIFLVPLLGSEFVPRADFSETSIRFNVPAGTSIEATEAKARQVDALVRQHPEVLYTLTTINTGNASGKNYANMYVRLIDRDARAADVNQISAMLRTQLSQVAGITVTHVGLLEAVGGQKQVEFSLQGPDLKELERLAAQVKERLGGIAGLVDLDSSVTEREPLVQLQMNRTAASDLGLSVGSVAAALRTLIAGDTVGNWRAGDNQTYDVNVRLAPEARESPLMLAHLPLTAVGSDGKPHTVRLNQIATISDDTGPSRINRRAMNREVSFSANAYQRSAGEVAADIRQALAGINFAPGYRYEFAGSTKNMQESFSYALSALALAVIFIYMILASQFRSFLQPLALMTSLPLTLIGVVLTLLMFGSTLSMFSIIGVIMLMGLVTKNAILLIDFAIRARQPHTTDRGDTAAGLAREPALLLAAQVRLRPILMTTLAMIFGMVPLAFAISEGAEQRAPLGQAVIGGVITSSLLTLVVVPVVYCYLDDFSVWCSKKWRRRTHSA